MKVHSFIRRNLVTGRQESSSLSNNVWKKQPPEATLRYHRVVSYSFDVFDGRPQPNLASKRSLLWICFTVRIAIDLLYLRNNRPQKVNGSVSCGLRAWGTWLPKDLEGVSELKRSSRAGVSPQMAMLYLPQTPSGFSLLTCFCSVASANPSQNWWRKRHMSLRGRGTKVPALIIWYRGLEQEVLT